MSHAIAFEPSLFFQRQSTLFASSLEIICLLDGFSTSVRFISAFQEMIYKIKVTKILLENNSTYFTVFFHPYVLEAM